MHQDTELINFTLMLDWFLVSADPPNFSVSNQKWKELDQCIYLLCEKSSKQLEISLIIKQNKPVSTIKMTCTC